MFKYLEDVLYLRIDIFNLCYFINFLKILILKNY